MNVEILIATWSKDIDYLKYCLKSIGKFATGFAGTTLLVAEQETPLFDPIASDFHCAIATYQRVDDPVKWHLQHQLEKCRADIHCPEAEFVLFLDSDCVLTEPVTPEDYFVDGKPVLLIEEYSRLPGNPWKATVDKALGIDSKYETMRRHPAVHHRGMFGGFRGEVIYVNRTAFDNYVLSQKPTFPWGFSEFASLGAFVMWSKDWRGQYHFIDCAKQPRPADKLVQWWSHSPPDQMQDMPSGGKGRPIDLFQKLGLI